MVLKVGLARLAVVFQKSLGPMRPVVGVPALLRVSPFSSISCSHFLKFFQIPTLITQRLLIWSLPQQRPWGSNFLYIVSGHLIYHFPRPFLCLCDFKGSISI